MRGGPPRVATWLLQLLVPASERAWLLGDVEERWRARATRDGRRAAWAWYWSRALTIPPWLAVAGLATAAMSVRRELGTTVRTQARSPLAAMAMVCTLALGIGAIAAVLSVVDAVLLEPLPFPAADRLVTIGHHAVGVGVDELPSGSAAHVTYERNRSFAAMALYEADEATVSVPGAAPVRVPVLRTMRGVFDVLGVAPLAGRPFAPEEDAPGGPRAVLLTERFWRSRYAADAGVVGQSLVVDGETHEIVGIVPEVFALSAQDVSIVLPLRVDRRDLGGFNTPAIARLRPGVTEAAAERELATLLPGIVSVVDFITPAILEDTRLRPLVRPYRDTLVGDVRAPLWIVFGAMSFVLLIACVNVGHLLLVRAEGRRQELAVRSALGAAPAQLLGLFLAEAGVLAAAGGALGIAFAFGLLRAFRTIAPSTLPRIEHVAIDGSVLAAMIVLTGAITVAFAALSQRVVFSRAAVATLRGGMRGATAGRGAGRLRRLLMASQVAFAALLLVGSGLTVRSLDRLRHGDMGFRADRVLTFRMALPYAEFATAEEVVAFHRAFLERIEAIAGVEVAGATSRLPLTGPSTLLDPLSVRGRPADGDVVTPLAEMRMASPGYFEALGIPIVRGRALDWTDVETRSGAVLVTEQVVRNSFAGGDPIGHSVAHGLRGLPGEREWSDVVGVAGDVRGVSAFEAPLGAVYYPMLVRPGVDMDWLARSVAYAIRVERDPLALVPAIRQALTDLDARLPLADVRTLDDVVATSSARVIFATWLLAIAAGLGLALGAIGLFGVTSIAATRRTREIGVRIALGATPAAVSGLIVRQGIAAAVLGLAAGLAAAALLARFLGSLLFEVPAHDPATYGVVAVVMLAVAAAASWLPAARAGRTDPRSSLDAG